MGSKRLIVQGHPHGQPDVAFCPMVSLVVNICSVQCEGILKVLRVAVEAHMKLQVFIAKSSFLFSVPLQIVECLEFPLKRITKM